MAINLSFFQAKCGDAACLRFKGNDGNNYNVFIDSGFKDTYRLSIRDLIRNEDIHLWIISHIHDDHIGGLMAYLDDISIGLVEDKVRKWWYNSPRPHPIGIKAMKSIYQGDRLYTYLSDNSKSFLSNVTNEQEPYDFFGLKIIVLSPSIQSLEKLRMKYAEGSQLLLEKEEPSSITYKYSKKNDYTKKLDDFDLYDWQEDKNIDNGSSIAVLTQLDGKSVLWLADSHPSIVLAAIIKLGYSKSSPLCCDVVKVTHHGSKSNNSAELYAHIKCKKYVFSVNGDNIHKLPDKFSFSSILRNTNRNFNEAYEFYFTYDNLSLRSIFDVDSRDVYRNFNFKVYYNSNTSLNLNL